LAPFIYYVIQLHGGKKWNLKVNSASFLFILYGLICRPRNTWQTCWKNTDNTNTSKADHEASRNTVPNFKVHTCKATALVQNANQEDYTVKLLLRVVTKKDVLVNISCYSHSTRMQRTVANVPRLNARTYALSKLLRLCIWIHEFRILVT